MSKLLILKIFIFSIESLFCEVIIYRSRFREYQGLIRRYESYKFRIYREILAKSRRFQAGFITVLFISFNTVASFVKTF